MPLNFSGIPEHAVRKDGTSVSTTDNFPWSVPMSFQEGGRVIAMYPSGEVDITAQYKAWFAEQPKTHSVTFTWVEES